MQPSQKAQFGRDLIKEAVIQVLESAEHSMTHAEIVRALAYLPILRVRIRTISLGQFSAYSSTKAQFDTLATANSESISFRKASKTLPNEASCAELVTITGM